MLSIFPSLLTYGMVAPLVIRITLAVTFAWMGYKKIRAHAAHAEISPRALGVVEIILAFFIFVGLFTQLMALLMAIILIVKLADKVKRGAFLTDGVNYYLILLVLAISLMFSGAGFFAFDLPL